MVRICLYCRIIKENHCINQYVGNGGEEDKLTADQRKAIPPEILEISAKAKEALMLYAAGKIASKELPADIYVNYTARAMLLNILKVKTRI